MLIYGVTVVSTEGDLIREDDNGDRGCFESNTKLFTDREERKKYAREAAKDLFEGFPFEEGVDDCDRDLATILSEVEKEEDVVITGSDDHYTIEFFRQEV